MLLRVGLRLGGLLLLDSLLSVLVELLVLLKDLIGTVLVLSAAASAIGFPS